MKRKILLILFVSLIIILFPRKGSTQSYYLEGKEWWFTNCIRNPPPNFAYFISDYPNEVTIEYPNGSGIGSTIFTAPGAMTILPIDYTYQHWSSSEDNIVLDVGIRVTSCKPGFLFYMIEDIGASDASHLIPLDKLDTHYVVTGLKENAFMGNIFPQNTNLPTVFVIVATEDNTGISIISRDTTAGSLPATIPDTLRLTLNRGQTYRFARSMNEALKDFIGVTGSEVISDKPTAVFACGSFGVCGASDNVFTQIPPYNLWGKRYITTQSVPRSTITTICPFASASPLSSADYIEILAGPNPTTVTVQGATTTIYNLKPFHSTRHIVPPNGSVSCSPPLYSDNGEANTIITSDYPVMIHQIMQSSNSGNNYIGDPSAITVFPESTWQNDWLIGIPVAPINPFSYITVVIKDEGTARTSLTLNGNSLASPANNWLCFPAADPVSNYRYQRFPVIGGSINSIKSDSAFIVYVTGEGTQTSYGFIGGAVSHSNDPLFLSAYADTVCPGELSSFFAEITGGTLPYKSFLWTGEGGFTSTGLNPQFEFPSGGTYKVRLAGTDATGKYVRNMCGDPFYNFIVFVKDAPDLNIGDNINLCKGDSITLYPVSPVEEKWVSFKSEGGAVAIPDNNPIGVSSNINTAGVQPSTLLPGMLTSVCIEIDHPVTSHLTISLTSPSGTTIELSSGNSPSACLCSADYHKTCFSDDANENITNAHAPFTGFFIPEEPLSSFNGEDVNGTWVLNVVDDTLLNEGELVEWSLNFSIPDSGISYSWSPSTGLSQKDTLYPTAFPDQTITYYLTKTLSNGCAITDSVTIFVNPVLDNPSFSYSAASYCQSEINPVPVISGGFSGVFTASPVGLVFTDNTSGEINLSASDPGTYSITFTTDGPCPRDSTVSITIVEGISLSTTVTNTICSQSNGEACVTVSGGATNYTYKWNDPGSQTDSCASGIPAGIYSVTVTDTSNCYAIATVTITDLPGPSFIIDSLKPASCYNGNDGAIFISSINDTAGYNYSWSTGTTTEDNFNLIKGEYTLTVQDTNNCTQILTFTISEPDSISFTISGETSICQQENVILTATVKGGTSPYSFNWDPGAMNGSSVNISPSATTTYTLTVSDANNCPIPSQSFTVNVFPKPAADFTMTPLHTGFTNSPVVFKDLSDGADHWLWMFGDILNGTSILKDPFYTYSEPGTYTITLTVNTDEGCKDTLSKTIIMNSYITLYIPNSFTPDGDGLNDFFGPQGMEFIDFEMEIYNRWGEMIYRTFEIDKLWNGKFKNESDIIQAGVYVYKIWVKDSKGETHNYVGNVTLIK